MIFLKTPANAMIFLIFLKRIVNVEIFESEYTTELILDFENDEELIRRLKIIGRDDILLNDNLIDMGFESYSPILNIGGLFLQYIYLAILLCLAFILQIILVCMNFKYKQYRKFIE
jgi:hypothetical protein